MRGRTRALLTEDPGFESWGCVFRHFPKVDGKIAIIPGLEIIGSSPKVDGNIPRVHNKIRGNWKFGNARIPGLQHYKKIKIKIIRDVIGTKSGQFASKIIGTKIIGISFIIE